MAYAEKAVLTVCFSYPLCTSSDTNTYLFCFKIVCLCFSFSSVCVCVFVCVSVCLSACVFVLILDHDDESFSGDLELWLPGRSV